VRSKTAFPEPGVGKKLFLVEKLAVVRTQEEAANAKENGVDVNSGAC